MAIFVRERTGFGLAGQHAGCGASLLGPQFSNLHSRSKVYTSGLIVVNVDPMPTANQPYLLFTSLIGYHHAMVLFFLLCIKIGMDFTGFSS